MATEFVNRPFYSLFISCGSASQEDSQSRTQPVLNYHHKATTRTTLSAQVDLPLLNPNYYHRVLIREIINCTLSKMQLHRPQAVFDSLWLLPLLLLTSSSFSSAFETHLYTTEQCTGSATSYQLKVSDGCQTGRGGTISGMINNWLNEDDNKLILATYDDDKCCHANLIQMIDWQDGCIKLQAGMSSWRVLDPSDPDKGKKGEDYNSCSK